MNRIICIILAISIYQCCLVSSGNIPGFTEIINQIISPSNVSMQTLSPDTSEMETTLQPDISEADETRFHKEGDLEMPQCELPPPSDNRAGRVGESFHWARRIMPYIIDENFPPYQIKNIMSAMGLISDATCVRFRPATSKDKNHVYFLHGGNGCSSDVGMQNKGRQYISLKPAKNLKPGQIGGCAAHVSVIVHEIFHSLGCNHEMIRDDRDKHVRIVYDNIEPSHLHNFLIPDHKQDPYGRPFDFKSIMMYDWNSFAKKGHEQEATIIPKNGEAGKKFMRGNTMTQNDIALLNSMYKCRRN